MMGTILKFLSIENLTVIRRQYHHQSPQNNLFEKDTTKLGTSVDADIFLFTSGDHAEDRLGLWPTCLYGASK